jgi:hypothetical protein
VQRGLERLFLQTRDLGLVLPQAVMARESSLPQLEKLSIYQPILAQRGRTKPLSVLVTN